MSKPNFRNINILLADSDACLAQAVISNLRAMGFNHVKHVKTSADAVQTIRTSATSFLITEWDLKGASGLDLVRYMRHSDDMPNRALPIIMLTGRGELSDVQHARDVGISEFVVKPFSAQTLFGRIEQIVDHPRGFVVSNGYIGPERRRRQLGPPAGMAERRLFKPVIAPSTREALKHPPADAPVLFAPDVALRQAIGTNKPLSTLITAEVLKSAQKAIDVLGESSLKWIREDIAQMDEGLKKLQQIYSPHIFEQIKAAVLSIKARSGTFGYPMASDIARLLYLFLSIEFIPTNPRHLLIIDKHIQVLTVIFAQDIRVREGVGAELYNELERLVSMHK